MSMRLGCMKGESTPLVVPAKTVDGPTGSSQNGGGFRFERAQGS